jgi:hypothetical protein
VVNKDRLRSLRYQLYDCRVRLEKLEKTARDHGVVPLPRETEFTKSVRLQGNAFASITADDIASVTMGIRHQLAPAWRTIAPDDFVQIMLDQEEPVTARGSRAVHDPRAELEPLCAMLEARMPVRANILVPAMQYDFTDQASPSFRRVISVPVQSSAYVRESLEEAGYDDITFVSHEPERLAFVLGFETGIPASAIFGTDPNRETAEPDEEEAPDLIFAEPEPEPESQESAESAADERPIRQRIAVRPKRRASRVRNARPAGHGQEPEPDGAASGEAAPEPVSSEPAPGETEPVYQEPDEPEAGVGDPDLVAPEQVAVEPEPVEPEAVANEPQPIPEKAVRLIPKPVPARPNRLRSQPLPVNRNRMPLASFPANRNRWKTTSLPTDRNRLNLASFPARRTR